MHCLDLELFLLLSAVGFVTLLGWVTRADRRIMMHHKLSSRIIILVLLESVRLEVSLLQGRDKFFLAL